MRIRLLAAVTAVFLVAPFHPTAANASQVVKKCDAVGAEDHCDKTLRPEHKCDGAIRAEHKCEGAGQG
jgi:hypothetical protein